MERTLLAVVICSIAVAVCFFYVDRPVAYFVHKHEVARTPGLVWLTYPPPIVQAWSPLLLVLLIARRAWLPWRHWQLTLFAACASLIVADQCRESLGSVCGRYWPETWHDNNPSLIGTVAYGFHPFQSGDDTGSFPSGHAARVMGFVAVMWLGLPRGRWIYAVVTAPMLIAHVATNYHFVSDVIAGSVVGGVVGAYAAVLGGVPVSNNVLKAR